MKSKHHHYELKNNRPTNQLLNTYIHTIFSSSVSVSLPRHFQNPKRHHHAHNNRPLIPVMCHIISLHFTHFNIIFPYTSRSPKFSPSFRLSNENLYAFLVIIVCAVCPTNPFLLDLITLIILSEKYKSWSSSLWNFLKYPVTSSLSGTNTFRNNSCLTHSAHDFSLPVRNQVTLFKPSTTTTTTTASNNNNNNNRPQLGTTETTRCYLKWTKSC